MGRLDTLICNNPSHLWQIDSVLVSLFVSTVSTTSLGLEAAASRSSRFCRSSAIYWQRDGTTFFKGSDSTCRNSLYCLGCSVENVMWVSICSVGVFTSLWMDGWTNEYIYIYLDDEFIVWIDEWMAGWKDRCTALFVGSMMDTFSMFNLYHRYSRGCAFN